MSPSPQTLYVFRRLYVAVFKNLGPLLGTDAVFESDVVYLASCLMRLNLRGRHDLLEECLRHAGARAADADVYVTLDYLSNVAWPELGEMVSVPWSYQADKGHLPIPQGLVRATASLSAMELFDLWALLCYTTTLHERSLMLLGGYRYFHVFYADESALDFERAYDAAYQPAAMPHAVNIRRVVSLYFEKLQTGGAYRWDILMDTLQMIGRLSSATKTLERIHGAEPILTRHRLLLTGRNLV